MNVWLRKSCELRSSGRKDPAWNFLFFDSFLVGNGNVCDEGFLWSLIYE
jgi:hypothetical protein